MRTDTEALKVNETRFPLIFVQNFINDAAFGERKTPCSALGDHDFVAEFAMGVGKTKVGDMSGNLDVLPSAGPAAKGQGRRPRLPEYCESGTDFTVAARQVVARGTRPLAIKGREKGMHFIKMSAAVPVADHVKTWETLHAKALEATPAFGDGLAGYELLQRVPESTSSQQTRCGSEMAVPDLVACFWCKTNPTARLFPSYVRAYRQADQKPVTDGPTSFFLQVEEWDVWTNPTFIE